MSLINWNDHLSVKVAQIDAQHQKLIAMINTLTDAIQQGKGKAVAHEIVRNLKRYAETHFKTEETYFDRFGYPETDAHKKEHAFFIRKISEFEGDASDGQMALSIQVLQFLGDWFIDHILGTDKKYTEFFNSRGLK